MGQKSQMPRQKHVPQRTCIACRQTTGKREFIRVVRTANGVEIDPTGKLAGRGAYLHPSRACWEVVLKGNRLDSALRTRLTADNRAALEAFAATLPEDEQTGPSTSDAQRASTD